MKNIYFPQRKRCILAVFSMLFVGMATYCGLAAVPSAHAVAPQALDNASTKGILRSNPRSTQGGMGSGGQVTVATSNPETDTATATYESRCEERKTGFVQKIQAYDKTAQAYEKTLDSRLERLIAIQHSSGIQSNEISSLTDAAKMIKQNEVRPAVDALASASLGMQLDCSTRSAVADMISLRDISATSRDALSEYRQAVKALALTMKDVASTSIVR